MSVKIPAPTIPVPNPLSGLASYTYALSLWWLDDDDYNNLCSCTDVDSAMAYQLQWSYVIAEDAGLYPTQRMPATGGLNFYLSDVVMTTSVQPSKGIGQTNLFEGTFKITEPYGATLMNCIINQAALDKKNGKGNGHYVSKNYLLQIEFFGYDDQGNQLPASSTNIFRKRYPINISEMKMNLTHTGMEYNCRFIPSPHKAHLAEAVKLPQDITVTGSKFGEVLDNLAHEYNQIMQDRVGRGLQQYADTIKFDIDPDIYDTPIVNPNTATLSQSDPHSAELDLTKSSFSFTYKADMLEALQKLFAQSKFLLDDQLKLGQFGISQAGNSGTVLNLYKVVVQSLIKGVNGSGSIAMGTTAFDNIRNKPAQEYTYKIHQYATVGANHTMDPSQFADSRNYIAKLYNYTFTGQNTEVHNVKLDFQWDYYTAILAYGKNLEAATPNANSKNDNQAIGVQVPLTGYALTPQLLMASGIAPQLEKAQVLMPTVIQAQISNANTQTGLKNKEGAIVGQDVMKNKQISSMLQVKLEIIGDPTLLKEDDVTYSPSPTKSTMYNNWDSMSQFEFAAKYGHLRMDVMNIIVGLQVNTPIDVDTEYNNTGLMFPAMERNGTAASYFSGQYYLYTVKSSFSKGMFLQELSLGRIPNQEFVNTAPKADPTDPVGGNQNNQRESTPTNTSKTSTYEQQVQSLQSALTKFEPGSTGYVAVQNQIATLANQQSGAQARQ